MKIDIYEHAAKLEKMNSKMLETILEIWLSDACKKYKWIDELICDLITELKEI